MNEVSPLDPEESGPGATGTEMQLFSNGEFEVCFTLMGDTFTVQAPGFARALGHRDANTMLANVPDDEKGYGLDRTPGGYQEVWHLTEPGFYRALGQRQLGRIKSEETRAKVDRFQRWVYHDVLPTIRRTGGYGNSTAASAEIDLSDPLEELEQLNGKLSKAITIAKQERDGRRIAEAKIKALEPVVAEVYQHRAELDTARPKAEYVDVFVDGRQDVTSFRVYCTQIEMPEQKFRAHLVACGVIYRKQVSRRFDRVKQIWEPVYEYHPRAEYKKWFHLKDQPEAPRHHNGQMRTTLYVSPLGKVKLLEWLKRHPLEGVA